MWFNTVNCSLVLCIVLLKIITVMSRPPFSHLEMRMLPNFVNAGIDQDQMVFPDDDNDEEYEDTIPRIQRQPCPDQLTFCEEYENYPYTQVEQALEKNKAYQQLFGKDEMENEFAGKSDKGTESFICGSKTQLIFPKVAKNKNNKWKVIVNQRRSKFDSDIKSDFIQGVRVEKCARAENTPCNFIDNTLGITTRCVQKYTYRRLIALSEDGQLYSDTFALPSACCCAYTQRFNFFAASTT